MLRTLKRGSRATAAVAIAQGVIHLSSLVRYAAVARLLSPTEFGIAALVAGAAQLAEIVSSAGADTILIQAKDGDEPGLQGAIHLQRAFRGVLNGALLLLFAAPLATALGLSSYVNALRLLAAFPILRGFYHTDCSRLQRGMQFTPWIITEAGSNLITTVAVILLATVLQDHRAVVAGVLLQAGIAVALSHAVSKRPYRWSNDRSAIRRYYTFSWPLVANSILIFAITQGDRFVVGSAKALFGNTALTLQEVGLYSSVATVTMSPPLAMGTIILSIGLPYLSQVESDERQFDKKFQHLLQWCIVIALCYLMPLAVYGPDIVTAVIGAQYAPTPMLVTAMAVTWALRIVRAVPAVAALAKADTKNGLLSNLARAAGLGGVCTAVGMIGTLETAAAIGALAEVVATLISFIRLSGFAGRTVLNSIPLLLTGSAVTGLLLLIQAVPVSPLVPPILLILVAVTLFRICGTVRKDVKDVYAAIR